jgi:hypothetical protein
MGSMVVFPAFRQLYNLSGEGAQGGAQFGRFVYNQGAAQTNQKIGDPVEILRVATEDHAVLGLVQHRQGWRHLAPGLLQGQLQQNLDLPRARHTGDGASEMLQAIEIGRAGESLLTRRTGNVIQPVHL